MPRYDYKCLATHCNLITEITHRIDINPEINCPKCQSVMLRQISKNVMFETPVDVEWEKDPSDLSASSYKKYSEAKKKKFRW
jgi:putative FmdB family regulatory protein